MNPRFTTPNKRGSVASGLRLTPGAFAVLLAIACSTDVRAAGPPVSDSFNSGSLNTGLWTFVNPVGDGSFQVTGGKLQLTAPGGTSHDLWSDGENAVRVMQPVSNVDLDVIAKFDSTPTAQYQMQGIVVEQDGSNYLRFDELSGGGIVRMFGGKILGGSATMAFGVTVTPGASTWLRVQRTGNTFTFSWSKDGAAFTTVGSYSQALTVAKVGVYGGNSGTPPQSFTAVVDYFQSGAVPDLTITKTHSGNFTQSASGTYTLTATNSGTASTSGTATVTDTLPVGLTPVSASGNGWTCGIVSQTVTCTSTSTIAAAASYPALTLNVNVAANAPASLTNIATVSGGGELNTSNNSASDPTTINPAVIPTPDLTITKSHSGNFTQGSPGSYTITVTNSGTATSSGTTTVTDTLPSGLTPVSASGNGWTCGVASPIVTCTSTAAVAAAASYPAITLNVNVAANAPATLTNTASVSGGGESNTANNSASDPTTITPTVSGPPVSDSFNSGSLNTGLWTFVNPVGDGSFQVTGGKLQLTAPGGTSHDLWSDGENAVRVMQPVSNVDLDVIAKFDSTPTAQYQMQGIVVEQDGSNYLRFDELSGGGIVRMFGGKILGGSATMAFGVTVTPGASTWLRVQRTGNTFTFSWSKDGAAFTTVGSYSQALTVAKVGVYGGNSGTPPQSFTAVVDYFQSGAVPDLTITKTHSGNFTQSASGTYTLTATNSGTASTSGTATVTDTLPVGLTPVSASGNGWTCGIVSQTVTCTSTSTIAAAASYPALTLNVNVAANAPASLTNAATVSGGGELNTSNNSASDPTTINPAVIPTPDLTITKSHSGNFTQGSPGSYTITVTNSGTATSSGTTTVTDTLPSGLTPVSASGNGWTCGVASPIVTCTSTAAVAAAASYPAITLNVNVAANAPATLTNTASVSGGGESNTANNSASDPTTITPTVSGPPVSDSFNSGSLDTGLWTFVNPVGDGSFQVTGGKLQLTAPGGTSHDLWSDGENAVRVMQPVSNVDLDVIAKFDSTPTAQYQMQGIVVEQDGSNYLRFDELSGGGIVRMFGGKILGGSATMAFGVTVTPGASTWLRVQRTGNTFTFSWSKDGAAFTTVGSYSQALTVAKVGVYGGNSGTPPQSFTAVVDYFQSGAVPDLTITKTHSGNFTQSASGTYTLTATNSGTASTSGTATVTDTLPVGLTPVSASGNGWTCGIVSQTVTCTSTSTIAAAASYPALTLNVNVAANAPASLTNTATVSGGGELNTSNNSASDPTTINPAVIPTPDLTITKSHSGNFTQGSPGSYTITVTNSGTATSSGTTTVTDTLPSGLTPVSASGNGWTCGVASPIVTCTSTAAVAAAASYPAITLNVNVAANAPATLTNTASVSGGGESNTANNSASDPTTITPASTGAPVSDDFFSSTLNSSLWTFVNPLGDGSYQMTGTHLQLSVPAGAAHDAWTSGNNTVRMVQNVSDVDFQAEAKFDSAVAQPYQIQGILVEQDTSNYLRFDVYRDATSVQIFSAAIVSGTPGVKLGNPIPSSGPPVWLRVQRSGTSWTFSWSTDGTTFNTAGTFSQAIIVNRVGIFGGNTASNPSASPAFVASVDYFFNTASPIVPQDGGTTDPIITNVTAGSLSSSGATVTWTTNVASSSQVDYGLTASYGSTTSNPAAVTSHSVPLSGLACNMPYNYRVTSTDALNHTNHSSNLTFTTSPCGGGDPWWNTQFHFRMPVAVAAGAYDRNNKPAEVTVNFTTLLAQLGSAGISFPDTSIRVVEVDGSGTVTDPSVVFQFDRDPAYNAVSNAAGSLVWIMSGTTAANSTRHYYVYFDSAAKTPPSFAASVTLTDNVSWAGQSSYQIATDRATYYYHKQGAGLASLLDRNGVDWIQYNTTPGSAGTYRGIPNAVNPEGYFHPGNTSSTSSVLNQGPIKLTIYSATIDDSWRCLWEIYPEYARFTMLKVGHPYWLLYEGTPNGNFQPLTQFWVKSDGSVSDLNTLFQDHSLPTPKWVYFGDPGVNRVLYFAHNEDSDNLYDIYYNLQNNMTVFGFGRTDNPVTKFLTQVPSHMTIGFAESSVFNAASTQVYSSYKDLTITPGAPSANP